jgi:hypothetical protein
LSVKILQKGTVPGNAAIIVQNINARNNEVRLIRLKVVQ